MLFLHYVVGLGRDDRYETRRIDERLAYTAPIITHASAKVYTLFIHSGEVLGDPVMPTAVMLPSVTATTQSVTTTATLVPSVISAAATVGPGAITATDAFTVAVTGAAGVVLLPGQTLTFTITPGLYQSVPITYINDFSDTWPPGVLGATISIRTARGAQQLQLYREPGIYTFLRRLVTDFLNIAVLTALVPALLGLIGGLLALKQNRLNRKLVEVETSVEQLVSGTSTDPVANHREIEIRVDNALPALATAKPGLKDEQQERIQQIELKYLKFYPLVKALRNQLFADVNALASSINRETTFSKEKNKSMADFLSALDNYKRHKANPAYPLSVSHDALFPNERLAFLNYSGLLDQISGEDVKALLMAHDEKELLLDEKFVAHFRKRQQLSRPLLPPFYAADSGVYAKLLQLELPTVIPFDVEPYLRLEEQNEIIVLIGEPGSGKTTVLELLQKVERKRGALYLAPVRASQLDAAPLLALPALIERALFAMLTSSPRLKLHLSDEPQGSRPGSELRELATLSSEMDRLQLDTLCLAVDDAPANFDYPLMRQQIKEHIRQEVFLRVTLAKPPAHPVVYKHLHLNWTPERLGELLDTINTKYPVWSFGWKSDEVSREELFKPGIVRTPHDLQIWIYALRTCYDGNDIRKEHWQALRTKMEQAREMRRPGAIDWQIEDAEAAQQAIKPQ